MSPGAPRDRRSKGEGAASDRGVPECEELSVGHDRDTDSDEPEPTSEADSELRSAVHAEPLPPRPGRLVGSPPRPRR